MSLRSVPVARLCGLAVLLIVSLIASVCLGAVAIAPRALVAAIIGHGDATLSTIVRELRIPRALQAALVGAALAASGAVLQAILRNALAEPYVLGVASGAAVGAVVVVVSGLSLTTIVALPLGAVVGAVCAILIVLRIAAQVGGGLDMRVVLLAGVIVGTACNAGILLLLTFSDAEAFRSAMFWMMGSHAGATWRSTAVLACVILPTLVVVMLLARPLDLLLVGEETAASLGLHVERTKLIAVGATSVLTAVAVAASGVIGFVGLVVPHVARRLWGNRHGGLVPSVILLGAAFMTIADVVARIVARPIELPIGAVMAAIGAPFFVWLLRRRASTGAL